MGQPLCPVGDQDASPCDGSMETYAVEAVNVCGLHRPPLFTCTAVFSALFLSIGVRYLDSRRQTSHYHDHHHRHHHLRLSSASFLCEMTNRRSLLLHAGVNELDGETFDLALGMVKSASDARLIPPFFPSSNDQTR